MATGGAAVAEKYTTKVPTKNAMPSPMTAPRERMLRPSQTPSALTERQVTSRNMTLVNKVGSIFDSSS